MLRYFKEIKSKQKLFFNRFFLWLLFGVSPVIILAQGSTIAQETRIIVADTAHQRDLIDIAKKLLKIKPEKQRNTDDKKVYFSFLPLSGSDPGSTGKGIITSTTAGFYLGPRQNTYLSSATFTPYLNFDDRYGMPLQTDIWLPNNQWNIIGDFRLLHYPQPTWGLGNYQPFEHQTIVDYNYIRIYQTILKKINTTLFTGLGLHYDRHFSIETDNPAIGLKEFTGYDYGTGARSTSTGLSFNLLYDTRNNAINPLPGAYAKIILRFNPVFLGSEHNSQSLYLDFRKYISLKSDRNINQNKLAFWTYYWSAFQSPAPYLDLPSIGWDPTNRSGRGIPQNRYRGKSIFYMESEYRRDITANGLFGMVLFANFTSVGGHGDFLTTWHPAIGTGLRIKFNKGSNTNIGIDFGMSKGYNTVLFSLGEAF